MGYIYKVTNKANGKVYIGKTTIEVQQRWNAHISNSFNQKSKERNFKFHNAIRKYGRDAFVVETIDDVEGDEETALREQYWIEFYDSIRTGYNTTLGGEGATIYSDEFFIKCWEDGMTCEAIHKKYGLSRNTVLSRWRALYPREEIVKRKIRNLVKANGTPIHRYDLDGNYIDSFFSVNDAKRITGINHIDAVARGARKKAGGFTWSYEKHNKIQPAKKKEVIRNELLSANIQPA